MIAQHVVLPLHIGRVSGLLRRRARDVTATPFEGDAFLINHPYQGGSPHAPDMAVITPVFVDGELFGFCGTIAHKSDIGGPVPGCCSGQAREIFNEGLQLPAVRYQRGGQRNVDLERIIAANSRTPELVLGDIRGQLGASRLGERRLIALVARHGAAKIRACFDRLFELAEGADEARGRGLEGRTLRGGTLRRRRRHRAGTAGAHPCRGRQARRQAPFRFHRVRRPDQGPGQCPPAAGAGGRAPIA